MNRTFIACIAISLSACTTTWTPPSTPSPTPAYQIGSGSPQVVWDAAVDFLVDTGTEWEFISNEMRTARMNVLLVGGPVRESPRAPSRGNPEAREFADCGLRDGEPAAGWGDLWAAIAIRVRDDGSGRGLLKVVVPEMWQTSIGEERVRCVSNGTLEAQIRQGIRERIEPILAR